jgi:hypothetical protein
MGVAAAVSAGFELELAGAERNLSGQIPRIKRSNVVGTFGSGKPQSTTRFYRMADIGTFYFLRSRCPKFPGLFVIGLKTQPQLNMNAENRIEYSASEVRPVSKAQVWTGRLISVLLALLLIMSGVMDVMKPDFVVKATTQMGYPEGMIQPLGVVLLICVVLYLIPNTAVLGAILLTGYLGGAVATHVRAGDPLFSRVLVPVYFATLLWCGLYLRYERVRALVPFRR